MTLKSFVPLAALALTPALVVAQRGGASPTDLLKPLAASWPTYSGDYSGRRYSALKQVTRSTVRHLTLAWSVALTEGAGRARVAVALV